MYKRNYTLDGCWTHALLNYGGVKLVNYDCVSLLKWLFFFIPLGILWLGKWDKHVLILPHPWLETILPQFPCVVFSPIPFGLEVKFLLKLTKMNNINNVPLPLFVPVKQAIFIIVDHWWENGVWLVVNRHMWLLRLCVEDYKYVQIYCYSGWATRNWVLPLNFWKLLYLNYKC